MIAYKVGDQVHVEYQDQIMRDSNEDAVGTYQQHVEGWRDFRRRHPQFTKTHLKTDGASCYSKVVFAKLLSFAGGQCGMYVLSHHIGEGGKNKTILDAHFGVSGEKVKRLVRGRGKKMRGGKKRKLEVVSETTLVECLAASQSAGSYVQCTTPGRIASFTIGGDALEGITRMSQRRYTYDEDRKFLALHLHQQSFLGQGLEISAVGLFCIHASSQRCNKRLTTIIMPALRKKALGDTTAADPPIARAEEVDQKSDTGHAVMRSGVQIEAEKAAKQERATDRTAKKNAKVVAEKEAAADVLRESNVFWCCLQDGGNEHCTRSFQKKGWLKKHIAAISSGRSECSGSVFSPYSISTTEPAPPPPGGGGGATQRRRGRSRQAAKKVKVTKKAEEKTNTGELLAAGFVARLGGLTEAGAVAGKAPPPVAGWDGAVAAPSASDDDDGSGIELKELEGGFACMSRLSQKQRTAGQLRVVCACYKRGAVNASQKMNQHDAAWAMEKSSTPEGIEEVNTKFPGMQLYEQHSAAGTPITSSRLDALDASSIKSYFSKSLAELEGLLKTAEKREKDRAAAAEEQLKAIIKRNQDKVAKGVARDQKNQEKLERKRKRQEEKDKRDKAKKAKEQQSKQQAAKSAKAKKKAANNKKKHKRSGGFNDGDPGYKKVHTNQRRR